MQKLPDEPETWRNAVVPPSQKDVVKVPVETDKYQISTLGRVQSTRRKKIMTPWISGKNKYPTVNIYMNPNEKRDVTVHKLVAYTFLPAPPTPEELVVDHIDRIATNNRLSNLKWITAKENRRRAHPTSRPRKGNPALPPLFPKHTHPDDHVYNIIRTTNGRFRARCMRDNKQVSLGTYDTLQEAMDAYDAYIAASPSSNWSFPSDPADLPPIPPAWTKNA